MSRSIDSCWWPQKRMGEGLEALAREADLIRRPQDDPLPTPPDAIMASNAGLADWLDWAAQQIGLEAHPVESGMNDLSNLLAASGPALIPWNDPQGEHGFLLLLGRVYGKARLIGPTLDIRKVPITDLEQVLRTPSEDDESGAIERIVEGAAIPSKRLGKVRAALMRSRMAAKPSPPIWMLRLPPSAGFWDQLRSVGLPKRLMVAVLVFILSYAAELTGWTLIGKGALGGQSDIGWLSAWLLLLLTMVLLRWGGGWVESMLALDVSRLFKSRLLYGSLRLDLESARLDGYGQMLGRVMESQALEALIVNGGLAVIIAVVELLLAAVVLALGASGAAHLLVLATWMMLIGWLSLRYFQRLAEWSDERLRLTNDLVERMVGHRTCLAQEQAGRRDMQQDQQLLSYASRSTAMDSVSGAIFAALPTGWIVLAIAALVPEMLGSSPPSPTSIAISIGGILLVHRALAAICGAAASIAGAAVSWRQVKPLFRAALTPILRHPFLAKSRLRNVGTKSVLVEASNISFRYRDEGAPVLDALNLSIINGERILLQGPSGGGKSTLAALLAGLRTPKSGLLLVNGLDRHTLGNNWSRVATAAPQFHENHIFSGSLAFNLLMGRQWPASEADIAEAEDVCKDLGLGELLVRMPGGIRQRVGETGWQLSHGERSRIFLGRALLQQAPLIILDESFAALDPETMAQCIETATRRAQTLMVIAHP